MTGAPILTKGLNNVADSGIMVFYYLRDLIDGETVNSIHENNVDSPLVRQYPLLAGSVFGPLGPMFLSFIEAHQFVLFLL